MRLNFGGGGGGEKEEEEKEGEKEKGGWEMAAGGGVGVGGGGGGEKKGGGMEKPRYELEEYEWGGEGVELEFKSIDERDSFKNMLALACGMSKMKEESGVVEREREEREDQRERMLGRIARQEGVLGVVRDRKDEVINDFKKLSKDQKALKRIIARKEQQRLEQQQQQRQ